MTGPPFALTSYGWVREHPQWREKHPHGPVTFDLWCPLCDKAIIEDGNLDDFKTALQIHAKEIPEDAH